MLLSASSCPPAAAPSPDGAAVLPPHLAQAVWRGDAMGQACTPVIASGHGALDAVLPGGGWPCGSLTEILLAQSGQAEWRLLTPALAELIRQGGSVLLIGPPHRPHLPALCREGLLPDRLVLIDARQPAECLWATEQALKAGCVSAVLSWLPQVRPEQLRRLHACAARHAGLLFVFRPMKVQGEASAAPLRLALAVGDCPHPMQVRIVKRRGAQLDQPLCLPHWPQGLAPLLPAALSQRAAPATPRRHPDTSSAAPPPASHLPRHAALDRLAAWAPGVRP